ncbi:hypothetical protein B0H14DRAFT_2331718, partial [Mycena olivaceomarginata]
IAVERRRWKERGKNVVPREWRKCRFCQDSVEDPAHAMFISSSCRRAQVSGTRRFRAHGCHGIFSSGLRERKLHLSWRSWPSMFFAPTMQHRCYYSPST